MARITLKEAAKSYGGTHALHPLTLEILDGEFFCLVGPSGCGKTTLLNLIAGLDETTAGDVNFDGARVTQFGPRERDVAMVFQSYALYPHMTVRQNIAFPLTVRGTSEAEIAEKVGRTAALLGLETLLDRRPKQLSGGQQQRVALGRALIRQPRVFLMDEPLSNLDARLRAQMRLELKRLHLQLPVTTVYVTHDQEEALSLSDRMAILDKGVVQQVGTPQQVYDRPANVFVARFIGKPEINILEGVVREGRVKLLGGEVKLSAGMSAVLARVGPNVLVGIRPEHVILADEGFAATVETIEPMGSETWVELRLDGQPLVAKAPGRFAGARRSEVHVRFDETHLHFFRPAEQTRIL